MDTIILFGASRGGRNFIANHGEQYRITAIVDNDETKQGTIIHNVPVIGPEQIHLFVFDYIVVASMYVHSITQQLKELNISEEKIKYASKNSMKVMAYPFKDPNILDCANRMIEKISKILEGVPHFYTFGTLLGIVRDGQLIPWDDDIDIAVYAEDALKAKELLLKHIQEINEILDIKMYMRHYQNGDVASLSIDCYYANEKVFNISLDCIYVEGNIAKQELNRTPLIFFSESEEYSFNNGRVNVPRNYEEYLKYTYGDWQVVKENTTFFDNALSFIEPIGSCTSKLFYESVAE